MSASLQQAKPQTFQVSASTCSNLSLFKEIMKEYRKLDDSVTMRLNRTTAHFRDEDRLGRGSGSVLDDSCAFFWRELVENWKRREAIVNYCVDVVNSSIDGKEGVLQSTSDHQTAKNIQGEIYAERVKRNQVRNELTVEKIVRQRSLDAFTSRCKFFEPPLTDVEARKWWELAQGRH